MAKIAAKVKRLVTIDSDMDKAMKKASDVNWSAVATQAFASKLKALKQEKTMKTVVDRLKQVKAQEQTEATEKGREIGRSWAADYAKPKELARLEKFADSAGDLGIYFNDGEPLAPWGQAEWLVFEILGTHEDDRSELISGSFWEGAGIDTDEPSDKELVEKGDFLEGFVVGALEVWEAVADQI